MRSDVAEILELVDRLQSGYESSLSKLCCTFPKSPNDMIEGQKRFYRNAVSVCKQIVSLYMQKYGDENG